MSARDEWDFAYLGQTNQPFIKANYPHHEGIWGWQDKADQMIMVVRNIRRSMVEYHDILWDIGYAKTFHDAFERIANLYAERPPMEDFLVWRDLRGTCCAHIEQMLLCHRFPFTFSTTNLQRLLLSSCISSSYG